VKKLAVNKRCHCGSEAPDNSRGSVVIILQGVAVVAMNIIPLKSPGEVLEAKLIVGAAADVDGDRVVDEAVGIHVPDAGHGMDEGAPSSKVGGNTRTADENILRNPGAEVAAAIGHQAKAGKAGKGQRLKGTLKPAITLRVDLVCEFAVGDSSVNVAIGKKSVKLCRHRDREQNETNKRQHCGGRLGHELFLPGDRAGKNSIESTKSVRCSVPDAQDVPVYKICPGCAMWRGHSLRRSGQGCPPLAGWEG